jgi:thiol-disulfide isomerase/thioredoxin
MKFIRFLVLISGFILITVACTPSQATVINLQETSSANLLKQTTTPGWFAIELSDVQTGNTFTMNDYEGKVVMLETMAIWCPNCVIQATQIKKLHDALGNPDDLITVSLDVDIHEDEVALKEYAASYGFDWHFAIAPLDVARALGNLYSAEYLNPPLSPMLIIDRVGNVHHLEYGIKKADALQTAVEPFLAD